MEREAAACAPKINVHLQPTGPVPLFETSAESIQPRSTKPTSTVGTNTVSNRTPFTYTAQRCQGLIRSNPGDLMVGIRESIVSLLMTATIHSTPHGSLAHFTETEETA